MKAQLPKDCVLALCDFETNGLDPVKNDPIEVGILFCDSDLNVLTTVESLIRCETFDESHFPALRVHGITPMLLQNAPLASDVVREIYEGCQLAKEITRAKKVVLCSDNAHFEHGFMQKLFRVAEGDPTDFPDCFRWPFHYCTWDTSLLLEMTGVGDPVPVHRAMANVGRLHTALVKAKRILEGI